MQAQPGEGDRHQLFHGAKAGHCKGTNAPDRGGRRVGECGRMYFPTKYSTAWPAAGQRDHPRCLFVPFSPWFYLLLTQAEAKLTGVKGDLPR